MNGLLALSRGIDRINSAIGRSVSWLILLAVLISAGNAIVRKVFSTSSNAWLELQWYLYGAAFLGAAAYTLLENEHIRIDILYGAWSRRVQHWIDLTGHLFFLMPFTLLMIWYLWPWAAKSFENGEGSASYGGLPLWPAKAMLLIGFVLLFFQGISEIIKKIAVMRGLIEDPHAMSGHHAPLEFDESQRAAAGFADPDHPLSDLDVDHPLHADDRKAMEPRK